MNIIKLFCIVLFVSVFVGCDDSEWKESDINLVSVYASSAVSGSESLHSLEVYPEQQLLIEFVKQNELNSFTMYDFKDQTDDEFYKMEYTIHRPALTNEDMDTTLLRYYQIEGTKVDSSTLSKMYNITMDKDTILLGVSTMKMFETERYY